MTTHFHLEIALIGIRPRIWRSFHLPATRTFLDLHYAIQAASGWSDTQRCSFHLAPDKPAIAEYAEADDDYEEGVVKARDVRLDSVLGLNRSGSCLQRTGTFEWKQDYTWQRVDLIAVVDNDSARSRVLTGGYGTYPKFPWWMQDDYNWAIAAITGTHPEGGELSEDLRDETLVELDGWRPELFELERSRRTFDK